MTQTIDFTLLVHGQKGFGYTRHSEIGNINKYLGGNSVQLACPDRENLFETEKSLLSDDIGYFNPSGLTDYLRRKGIDSQEPTKININLVGGDFSKCLLKAFQITSIWTEKSPLFNKTAIFLPSDAVFDYYKEQNRPIVLSEIMKDEADFLFPLSYYCGEFYGRVTVNEKGILFAYRETPEITGCLLDKLERADGDYTLKYLR